MEVHCISFLSVKPCKSWKRRQISQNKSKLFLFFFAYVRCQSYYHNFLNTIKKNQKRSLSFFKPHDLFANEQLN